MFGTGILLYATILTVGLLTVIVATESYGLRFGGVIVVPLLAMYVLFDYRALPLFVLSTVGAYVSLLIIERRTILYGRQLLITAIVAGALVPVATVLLTVGVSGQAVPLGDVAYLGSVLPGIAAYNLYQLEPEERVADVVGSLTLVVGLVVLAALFLMVRSAITGPLGLDPLLATVVRLVIETGAPAVPEPAPVLPRSVIVGLFVVGLLLNEAVRRRYGLRLAGLIVLPLMAIFTLQDIRLLALFVVITAVGAGFIRLIHRSTFLYGRNLLAGTCLIGILLAVLATPFLPAAVGLRPLVIGILGGITAYNGHVLAPGERVTSVALNAGTFVVLFALATGAAGVLDRPFVYSPDAPGLVVGGTLLVAGGLALLKAERLRPAQPIDPIMNDDTRVVPDGGPIQRRTGVSAGEPGGPLAGRRVVRVGPNAKRVYRERRE